MANPNYKETCSVRRSQRGTMDDRKEQNYKSRQRHRTGDLKSSRGLVRLTGDLLKQARGRATQAGVTDGQFASFMGKNSIRQNATT